METNSGKRLLFGLHSFKKKDKFFIQDVTYLQYDSPLGFGMQEPP